MIPPTVLVDQLAVRELLPDTHSALYEPVRKLNLYILHRKYGSVLALYPCRLAQSGSVRQSILLSKPSTKMEATALRVPQAEDRI